MVKFSHKSISYPNALPGLDVKRPNGRIGTAGVQDLANSVRGHGGDGATVTFKNLWMIIHKTYSKQKSFKN